METTQPKPDADTGEKYAYLERSFATELLLFMLFGPILAALWIIVVYYVQYSGRLPLPLFKSAVYFTVTLIFAAIFYNNSRLIAKTKSVVVEKERVIKRNARGLCFVRYESIRDIRLTRIPFVKRWITLETDKGEKFTIPLGVRGGEMMIRNIFRNMQEAGTFLENSGAKAENLGAMSKRIGTLYELREKNMPNVVRAVTVVGLLYGIVPALYWNRGLITMVPLGMVGMFLQAGAYFAVERLHLKALLRSGAGVWDDDGTGIERSGCRYKDHYLISGLAAAIVGMALGILATHPV